MKFIVRCWLIAMLITAPAVAHASNCRAVVVRHNVVEKVIVKEVVAAVVAPVVATFVPVAVAVPIYNTQFYGAGAGYAPAYSAPAPVAPVAPVQAPCPDQSANFKQVAQLLLQLDQRLSKIEGVAPGSSPGAGLPASPAPMQPADPVNPGNGGKPSDPFAPQGQPQAQQQPGADRALALANKHCASCHDATRSRASGKGFTLLSGGKFADITPEQAGLVVENVAKRTMPPRGHEMSDADRLEFLALLVGGK